jgi:ABC-type Fe3+/spermidine/putrescine transport system ATPase subunit
MIRFGEGREEGGLSGKVKEVSFLGSLARYVIEMENGEQIRLDEPNPKRFRAKGSAVHLLLDEETLHLQKAD